MCKKSLGRNSYARALVEVSSLAALKEYLVVTIPFPNGMMKVEYEWQPPPGYESCKILLLSERMVQKPPTNNNDKATTSNSDSSLRKDSQPTMQPEDGINIVLLHNSFESLMEKDKDSSEDVLDDEDEEVKEVYIEDNGRHAKQNKGASIPSDQKPPMPPISLFPTIEKSADEHEICDGFLTGKEQQQLLLDEEAFRETLEEEARSEKERARAEKE
ncbi:hypothetical protein Tco_1182456 [Tanacetum coccineum]